MILYVILCVVLLFFLFKKEGFKNEEYTNEIERLKGIVSNLQDGFKKIDDRVSKIEKNISDFTDS